MKQENLTILDKIIFPTGALTPVISPWIEAFNILMYVMIYTAIAVYIVFRTVDKYYDLRERWLERKVRERKLLGLDKKRKDDV